MCGHIVKSATNKCVYFTAPVPAAPAVDGLDRELSEEEGGRGFD